MIRVFLSHSWKDKSFVRTLAKKLKEAGFFVWVDEAEISVGDSLVQKITDGLEESDYVVAIISTNSVKSDWVRKELQLAMYREIAGHRVHVLPVIIDHCDIPYFLRDKLYADFSNRTHFEDSFKLLLHAFPNHEINSLPNNSFNMIEETESIKTFGDNPKNDIGKINVGSLLRMKETADFRLTKKVKHCRQLSLSYCIMATIILFVVLLLKAKFPSVFPSLGSRLIVSCMFSCYVAAAIEFLEANLSLLIIQNDKAFLFEIESVEGSLLPFGKNWFSLLRIANHNFLRIFYLIINISYYILPILTFVLIFSL